MGKLKQLEEELTTNDINFDYGGDMYVICPMDEGGFSVCKGGSSDNEEYSSFQAMAEGWVIEGKPLKEIVNEITLL